MVAKPPRRIYWDACAWIGFINAEPDKMTPLRGVWDAAIAGDFEIWTSAYSYMEVIKGKAEYGDPYPPEESDRLVEEVLTQSHVQRVQLDTLVGRRARKLKRDYHAAGLTKRSDAIHLATALEHNCEELHTWDKKHLLQFDGKFSRRDGIQLRIFIPNAQYFSHPLLDRLNEEPKEPPGEDAK